jgi:exodeoxyribonuclease-3
MASAAGGRAQKGKEARPEPQIAGWPGAEGPPLAPSTDTLRLCCLNVNGLRSATSKGLMPWLHAENPDVVCLQELRIQTDQVEAAHRAPTGWTTAQADAEKKGYSGASVWTRLPVLGQPSVRSGLPLADLEGRYCRVDTSELSVVSLYVPSGSSGEERQGVKDSFLGDLRALMDRLAAEGRPMVVCGDINIAHTEEDIHNAKSNKDSSGFLPHERAWMTELLASGWVDLWRAHHPGERGYSWWSNRGQARALDRGWRIDYLLCTPDLAARATRCWLQGRSPALSDHAAVWADFRRA